MKKLSLIVVLATSLISTASFATTQPKLLLNMPDSFNSPASADLDKAGNMYFSSPNFHNDVLLQAGLIKKPQAATIGKVDGHNQLSTWYTFTKKDLEATTGQIAPMGIGLGPDGNLYVADMQMWFKGGKYKSRLLRINVKDGKAVSCDVVASGLLFPNAVQWHGNDLYVSDTVLTATAGKETISGVYKFNLAELSATNPVQLTPYVNAEQHDQRLFETFKSNGKLTFGANGLTFDSQGNLYTSIMEEGAVVKTIIDKAGHKVRTVPFTKGMKATDGMHYDAKTNKIYITDLFDNAVYSIDMQGKLTLIAKNGDTDGAKGELDAPSEVIVRGDEAIVMNFDAIFDSPEMVNKSSGRPYTLSVIKLK